MKFLRVLVAVVLGFLMVGFGLCAACGGVIMIQDHNLKLGGMFALTGLLAVACFYAIRALLRKNAQKE
jgi:hypothetical protein